MVLSNKQISRYSKLLTIEKKEILEMIEMMNIPGNIKDILDIKDAKDLKNIKYILDKKIKNIFHHANKTPKKDLLGFIDDNIYDI
jgi:hypothetical protein